MADTTVRTVMAILIDNREKNATSIQELLTEYGCFIKTRLGLHEGVPQYCSNSGLIILELVDDEKKHEELKEKLNQIPGVKADLMRLSFNNWKWSVNFPRHFLSFNSKKWLKGERILNYKNIFNYVALLEEKLII